MSQTNRHRSARPARPGRSLACLPDQLAAHGALDPDRAQCGGQARRVARLDDETYYVTTTSTGADGVYQWFTWWNAVCARAPNATLVSI